MQKTVSGEALAAGSDPAFAHAHAQRESVEFFRTFSTILIENLQNYGTFKLDEYTTNNKNTNCTKYKLQFHFSATIPS